MKPWECVAVVVVIAAAVLASLPDVLARLLRLRPIPLHRRVWVQLRR